MQQTVADVLRRCEPAARQRFASACQRQGVAWPPRRVTLLVFKQEKRLEAWGANARGSFRHLADFPILAASGRLGPKRRQGDFQVPEGFYRLSALNPNSAYHLSLRVDYPNVDDRRLPGRLPGPGQGGDIYVHGHAVSIGCVALGDAAIEHVFCLVARAAPVERRILLAPLDFRPPGAPAPRSLAAQTATDANEKTWLGDRYERLRVVLRNEFSDTAKFPARR